MFGSKKRLAKRKRTKTIDLFYLGITFFIFNIIDIYETLYAVLYVGSEEQNKLMAALINYHPYSFAFAKLFLGTIAVYYLCKKNAWSSLFFACLLYYGVVVWNLSVIVIYHKLMMRAAGL